MIVYDKAGVFQFFLLPKFPSKKIAPFSLSDPIAQGWPRIGVAFTPLWLPCVLGGGNAGASELRESRLEIEFP